MYLAVEDIDHSRTKANHPQTNGICERLHETLQDECYSLFFCKKLYYSLEELQVDLDAWLENTIGRDPTQGAIATARPRGKPSSKAGIWPWKRT